MTWDPTVWSNAADAADKGMEVPEGLMSFASTGRGKPTREQRSLFLGAVAFSYAVWENYVEDVAVELTTVLAEDMLPERVPTGTRDLITQDATPWQIMVHPGWRGLWVERVTMLTKGDPDAGRFGLNTASVQSVKRIFGALGIDPVPQRLAAPADDGSAKIWTVPPGISADRNRTVHVSTALDTLIKLRGEAVHTAQTSDVVFKREVWWWRTFVQHLCWETDRQARRACAAMLDIDFPESSP